MRELILGGIILASMASCGPTARVPGRDAPVSWAGMRASSYGISPFPEGKTWISWAGRVEALYPGSVGTFVWIVGNVTGNGPKRFCTLNFPLDRRVEGVRDFPLDQNEDFLSMCDRAGYAVWLQVEPGDSDLPALAEAVMERYRSHPSVRGFGVDVEWYRPAGTGGAGQPLGDDLARELDRRVKAVDRRFSVFLKHWDAAWLPPTYRSDLIFVNDSQGHESLSSMKGEFASWAARFYPNPVMFQIGYPADQRLWGGFSDPVRELGNYLVAGLRPGQEIGIVWVDFTLRSVMESTEGSRSDAGSGIPQGPIN